MHVAEALQRRPSTKTKADPPKVASQRRTRPRALRPTDDDVGQLATRGWIIIALFFGLLGSWSLLAPLNGAVVANGFVKLEGNRKSLQHHDGGLVRRVLVREGDKVDAGQILIGLDDTQVRAEYDILSQQHVDMLATDARMQAELARQPTVTFSPEIIALAGSNKTVLAGQIEQFELRRHALDGQRRIIGEKIAQLEAQIQGAEAQTSSNRSQRDSIKSEAATLAPLVERGVIAKPRLLQLERSAAAFDGQIGELSASIARNRQAIAEQMQLASQLERDRSAETAKDLRAVQSRLAEVAPRLTNAKQQLARMEIRAPYAGRVVGLTVFSTGGVIAPGEKILDIVPEHENLIVEARIGVEDIGDITPGSRAEIRLLAYKQRTTPSLLGEVIQVSADRLVDNRSGNPYYLAQIKISEGQLSNVPGIKLYPGMPASIMIPTAERTAFDYLVGPLFTSLDHSFRQK